MVINPVLFKAANMNQNNSQQNLCILQVLPALISGGVERGTIDIALALIQKGHQAIVISSGGSLVKQLDEIGATHIHLPVQSKNPWKIWKNAQVLKRIIQTYQVDIIHARSRAPAWSCYWASKSSNTPYTTTFHGAYGHSNRLKRWYNAVMLRSNMTIAVSDFIAEHIAKTYPTQLGKFHSKVKVIHRGIDTHTFSCSQNLSPSVEQLKKQWQLPNNKTIIMLPGRITRLKGHSVLIHALSKLDTSNILCLFVGDNHGNTNYQQELEALIAQHKLCNTIYLVGGCHNMAAAYQMANIVVSASVKPESFGRVSCEAQAMDCLVVATNHGGTREIMSDSQKTFLCEPNNSESMQQALLKALATPKEAQSLIFQQSRKHIEANFSLDKMCRDTLAIYQQLKQKRQG